MRVKKKPKPPTLPSPKKLGAGRPSVKTPAMIAKIMELARQGKTDVEICDITGLGLRTLGDWKVQDWEFSAILKENKAIADEIVETSLFKRATGYSHPEEKVFCSEGMIVTHETTKHYPPDPTAMIFWLKNRQPDTWREKREDEIKIMFQKQEMISKLPTEELIEHGQRLIKQVTSKQVVPDPKKDGVS